MTNIIRNAIITPDGTVLESRHRHDFRSHTDTISGEIYMVDGGLDYLRRSVNKVPAKDSSVTLETDHETARNLVTWGTYGKSGREKLHYILVKDMTEEHIQAILSTQLRIHPQFKILLTRELEWREKND